MENRKERYTLLVDGKIPLDFELGTAWGIRLFFVKYFSLKKASEFPFFSKGFSLLSAGIMHPCA